MLADRHTGHLRVVVTVAERQREDELISDRHGSDQRIATRVELVDQPTDGVRRYGTGVHGLTHHVRRPCQPARRY